MRERFSESEVINVLVWSKSRSERARVDYIDKLKVGA